MTTYVFPGQGSQVKGMGEALFPEFPEYTDKADKILGYSIATLCLQDPNTQLNQTNFTQPALYVVNALSYLKKQKDTGVTPDYLAGHSLGEYNALFAAGAFDFETGLKLVQKRGELMSHATGGGMAAVIGLQADAVLAVIEQNQLKNISIANYNSNTQIIVSGLKDAVLSAKDVFTKAGAMMYIPLNVSGAFHSSQMDASKEEFAHFISSMSLNAPKIPVIANLNALPYTPENLLSNLMLQINHPVLWTQSIEYLMSKGETVFEEVGPGRVLTGMINKIQKGQ